MIVTDGSAASAGFECGLSDRLQLPESTTSREPDLKIEFDGTTVLCRVCGDKASGFHYGVHSCEGCKGFFRRSIQQKIQYRPCTKNQQCSILRINRNRCQYCRLKKCIAVGMSRDAVRFGRVPKREKARILAAMQQSSNSRSHEKAVVAELEDEQRLLATVVRAHLDTCDFTRDKVAPMLARALDQPSYTACPPTLACPLNPNPQPLAGQQELIQDFSKRFSPAIRGVVEFAKRIPGFSLLPQDDQVTLLKGGVFEVLLVRLACMFDSQTNSMVCLNGQVLKRDVMSTGTNAHFLMDSMFDFADRLNSLRLSDAEVGLFCSVVVIAPDRPGLRNRELVERMQSKLCAALEAVMAQNHPGQPSLCQDLIKKIPDLRTLNTLHSEKLLAFKMTEQQQQQQEQQQQQQQQQLWATDEDSASKSPPASCSWSSGSDAAMDEAVKSPLGSVSSTESLCSNEVAALSAVEYSSQASQAPLLAATLAGGCPRQRASSGSSGDEDPLRPHLPLHHLLVGGLPLSHGPHGHAHLLHRFRRLDSPSDSGIESGPDKPGSDRPAAGSAPTSVCSSPRSSLEDKDDDKMVGGCGGGSSVEDMPVLKRVLQAPPLYDTNSLMDEAYKPHKKFRALRNKDSAEAEAAPQPTPSPVAAPAPSPIVVAPPAPPSIVASSLSSTHSTLAKSLMEGPRMTAEQQKRTDIIHSYIMRGDGPSAPAPAAHPDFPPSPPSYQRLAPSTVSTPAGLLACASAPAAPSYHHPHHSHHPHPHHSQHPQPQAPPQQQYIPVQPQQQQRWAPSGSPGVITTSCPARAAPPPPAYLMSLSPPQQQQQHAGASPARTPVASPPQPAADAAPTPDFPRIYFHAQGSGAPTPQPVASPLPHSSTSPSPSAARRSCSPAQSPAPSSAGTGPVSAPAPSPRMVELQVDCIADSQQPLNLSKKSPSPSPAAVPMEA